MSDLRATIDHITHLVDTYHGRGLSLHELVEIRADLATYLFRLSSHVKGAYGRKALSYVYRKYAIAREIAAALEQDKAAIKKRPMNMLEAQTEALDHVLQRRKEEVEAEAQYEEITAYIDSAKQVLAAMQQEIADLRHEKNHSNYLDRLAAQEAAKNQATQA